MAKESLLVDTHILIWLMTGDKKLWTDALKLIDRAASADSLLVSAISIWEIAMLVRAERLQIEKPVQAWIDDLLACPGLRLAPLSARVAVESCNLPGHFHGDPADRIIVATARVEGAVLLTRDKKINQYGKLGHVPTVDNLSRLD